MTPAFDERWITGVCGRNGATVDTHGSKKDSKILRGI
jgi:hypothetical protein